LFNVGHFYHCVSISCVDRVNPRTGVSDCPRVAYLCNNSLYYNLMTEQCPRTCSRCQETGNVTLPPVSACVDRVNSRTGVSDCPQLAHLCNNSVYYTLMTQQCPRTCNRCSGTMTTTPTSPTASSCRDLVNPRTGISDCPRMVSYCRNTAYLTLMRQQCPKTCGYCV
uniref:ShTK domain protein n=1 Tax=Angiostrongylus cantonensis TaxID=6313 RepID=A0A0K0CYH3_ANGCA